MWQCMLYIILCHNLLLFKDMKLRKEVGKIVWHSSGQLYK